MTHRPDLIAELRAPSDRPRLLAARMREWIDNGVALGRLIDPGAIYRPRADAVVLAQPATLAGEGPRNGFVLGLTGIW